MSGMIKEKQQQILDELIKENLLKGIAKKTYRKDIPLEFTSKIYFVGILGVKDRDLFPEKEYTTNDLVEKHLEYHLRAIVTPKGLESLNRFLKK